MTRRLASLSSLVRLSAVALAAGCFTGPINQHPRVELSPPAAAIMRGKDASFTFVATDPDDDPLDLSWGVASGACRDNFPSWTADHRPLAAGERQVVVEGSATLGPFCVCVFAEDSHHAKNDSCVDGTPVNRPPDTRLRLVSPGTPQPFPLFSRVRVSGAETVDTDAAPGELIRYDWGLTAPSSSTATLAPCDPNAALDRCFLADIPGTYSVTLQATDSLGASYRFPLDVQIAEDRLPCIRHTTPELDNLIRDDDADAPRGLSVDVVDDDGDPYPGSVNGRTHFAWYSGLENGPMSSLGNDFNTFVPGGYRLGDVVQVRVVIGDRDKNAETIRLRLIQCGMNGDALCASAPGSDCILSVTWTVRFRL
ncbi:MAG TPA: hypothetical protein VFH68_26390 [Polyangia bacterium]|jgi:hypothetical protein|nr:hypothetical protein [Polyangia bacterium]